MANRFTCCCIAATFPPFTVRSDDDNSTQIALQYAQSIALLEPIGVASGMSPAEARQVAHEVIVASLAHPWRMTDVREWLIGAMTAAVEHHRGDDGAAF